MGKPMALNLVRAGFDVIVASRSRPPIDELTAAGAREAASLAEVAASADVVCTCLPDVATSRNVYLGADGLAQNARAGQVLIETSTIGPALARETAAAVAERGAGYLDAPISGGVERAVSATLTIMAGGEERHFQTARPVLDAMGAAVHSVGPVGQGSIVKLTNQLLVGVHTIAACEAFLFGTSAGANPQQLLDVLSTSWGASNMMTRNGPMLVSGDYGSLAPVRLLVKDLGLDAGGCPRARHRTTAERQDAGPVRRGRSARPGRKRHLRAADRANPQQTRPAEYVSPGGWGSAPL